MLLAHVPLHTSSHSILITNQRNKSLTINPQNITAKSHSSSPSSSSSSLSFNQTLGVHPLQPTNEPPNNISREVDGSAKGDKKKENKRRVFLLDVNPLCYNGSTPSLDSFAHWVSLFFSQVTLKDPVIAVIDGERGDQYDKQLLPSYKAHGRKLPGHTAAQGFPKGPIWRSHQVVIDILKKLNVLIVGREVSARMPLLSTRNDDFPLELLITEDIPSARRQLTLPSVCGGVISCLAYAQVARASVGLKIDAVYEIGELFELGIQLSYLLLLLGLLGVGTFFVIRQVLVRRELDLSAKELQEQVRSGDASATELFELGAVMLRRKFYPAATKYLLQAIEKWDGDDQDLAQVHNALGVSYVRDGKLEKGIAQFESAVKLQPGYVTAWNNLGDAYEKNKDMKSALKAFEEVLLFDPNNKIARPRRDVLKEKVQMYKGVAVKTKQK